MLDKTIDIKYWNRQLKNKTPGEIIDWALALSHKRILTTSFGKYSAVLLNTFYLKKKDIKVIWCDTGYNLPATYEHAIALISRFKLNIHTYVPLKSKAFLDSTLGPPDSENFDHDAFTELVKLEPFRRALKEHQPDIWFTNIRVRQTEFRDSKDILSFSKDGILKVSPFYYWSDKDLDGLIEKFNLPLNATYFDPIKALASRECGIHFQ